MTRGTIVLGALVGVLSATAANAVTPTPLENAYWRLDGGVAGNPVPTGPNTVLDSIHANHMQTANAGTAPMYTSIVPAGIVPQTGALNTLSLQFSGSQDIYTRSVAAQPDGKNISHPITTAFTLEASFMAYAVGDTFHAIVGKDGKPNAATGEQTLALKLRGDNSLLQIEQYDAAGTLRQVSSLATIVPNRWYHAAAVNTGTTLSLYVNDGSGYVLQGSTPVSGALFQNDTSWTIGRGAYNDGPADWFNGLIDEVRLSNTALAPSAFLFVPEPASLALLAIGGLGLTRRRSRQS